MGVCTYYYCYSRNNYYFYQRENYTPYVWGYQLFPIDFIYEFLHWPPCKSTFFLNFLHTPSPWNSNYFYSTSLEFSIVILNMSCIGSPARFRTFNTFEIIFLCNFVFFNVLILLFYYNKNISFLNVPFLFFNYLN